MMLVHDVRREKRPNAGTLYLGVVLGDSSASRGGYNTPGLPETGSYTYSRDKDSNGTSPISLICSVRFSNFYPRFLPFAHLPPPRVFPTAYPPHLNSLLPVHAN